jgi:hypothetical protein
MSPLLINSNLHGNFRPKQKKLYVTANQFNADGETIIESSLIQYNLKKVPIYQSLYIIDTSPLIESTISY